jgi:hypothetical protein
VDGHLEIASADPLLYDFFQLSRRLFLLIHFETCQRVRLGATGHLIGTIPEYERTMPPSSRQFMRQLGIRCAIAATLLAAGIWAIVGPPKTSVPRHFQIVAR